MGDKIQQVLNETFGLPGFRPGQEAIVRSIVGGREMLVIMPTGGGKSLCYQLPALMLDGVTIVISPLIALMKDQVDALWQLNIPATFINSTLSPDETAERIEGVRHGQYKLLYIAPERFYSATFMKLLSQIEISLVAIDEAHCISQWGHDFRPSYLRLKKVIDLAGSPNVAAFTATATKEVRDDILVQLGIADAEVVVTGFDRPNLKYFAVELDEANKKSELLRMVRGIKGSGVVYVSTQKAVAEVSEMLNENEISAIGYHGGMDKEQRTQAQQQWLYDEVSVIVATNAFGMGIDKPDVRFVLHFNTPGSMEAYYQEAGRAGRDGKTAYCILFFNYRDHKIQEFFIENNYPPEAVLKDVYDFLFGLDMSEIYLTYREIGTACGVNEMMVAAAVKLFEHHGILERMNQQTLTFRVDFLLSQSAAMKLVKRAPLQKKMLDFVQLRDGDSIPLVPALSSLELSREQFAAVMRELVEKEILEYTPPFRGRGIVLKGKKKKWQQIGIDFERYQQRLQRQFERLGELENYIQRRVCRRKYILSYFGEKYPHENCNGCDVCLNWQPQVSGDSKGTVSGDSSDVILQCVRYFNGLYGATTVADLLTGNNRERFEKTGLTHTEYFGALAKQESKQVIRVIYALIRAGKLVKSDGDYPVLSVNDAASRGTAQPAKKTAAKSRAVPLVDYDEQLYQALRAKRSELADGQPAYTVCSDRVLKELAAQKPRSEAELLTIKGMGKRRVAAFGRALLAVIAEFA